MPELELGPDNPEYQKMREMLDKHPHVSIADFRKNLSRASRMVRTETPIMIVTNHGEGIFAAISLAELRRLQKVEEDLKALAQKSGG